MHKGRTPYSDRDACLLLPFDASYAPLGLSIDPVRCDRRQRQGWTDLPGFSRRTAPQGGEVKLTR